MSFLVCITASAHLVFSAKPSLTTTGFSVMVINQHFQHITDANSATFCHKVQSSFCFVLQVRIECFFIGTGLT